MSQSETLVKEPENIRKNISKAGVPVLNVGNPGNKGGTGRPPSELRAQLRAIMESHGLPTLIKIMESESPINLADRLRAADIAGKYGLGEPTKLSNPEFVAIVAECALPYFEGRPDEYKAFVQAIERRAGQ